MTGGPDTGARRHRRAGRGLAGLAVLVAALAWPTPARADPAVTVTPAAARLDQTVTVELTGWPPGVVTVALCGNEARQGSADCAVATAAAATVPDAGTTRVPLRLTPPPAGCPCVVRAVTATGDRAGAAALAVVDVPDSATVSGPAGQADGPRTVELVAARLDERWTLPGLLGGPAERTLRLDLRNPSGTPLRDLVLTLDLGRAAGTGGAPPPVPVPDLAAGERRVVEVPVTIGAPAVGRYPVTGRIDGLDAPVTFTAHTSSWPWLLPVVLPLVVCGVVLARRLRARPGRRGAARPGGAEPDPAYDAARPAPAGGGRHRRPGGLRLAGVGLIALGVGCAVVLAGQTLLPGRETAAAQRELAERVDERWADPGPPRPGEAPPLPGETVRTSLDEALVEPPAGEPLAVMHVPRWRARYTIVQGVGTADLRKGPGHYPGSALPGRVGNFSVAGHRGPAGEPFNDIDRLTAGDAIVVETAGAWYVYRVERHVIVTPDRVDVVAEVPERPGVAATKAMMTMTACHPRYSSKLRYVLFSTLAESMSKADSGRPAALDE